MTGNNATAAARPPLANPAPLGLLGFGMTTVLLNLHNAGFIGLTPVIAAMGFALGGLAQLVAGLLEFRAGNTFGGTAFTAYGLFWWSLILIWMLPASAGLAPAEPIAVAAYLALWGLFTTFMFVGTLKHDLASQIVFGSLALLFFTLSLGDASGVVGVTHMAGWIGIVCGLAAIYSAMAQVINAEYGRTVLPRDIPRGSPKPVVKQPKLVPVSAH
ncbi:MAG: acetate uptake transporter [Bifidobacteriaceae bacterium]|jgi:succinate-acetate transporter protein|nr:acetate uptake transporter [Bifidobacteriaceae bacterium]